MDSDSEIRDSSDEESGDVELLESAFDSSYTPAGNLARLACAGFVFFLVAKTVHTVFPLLSSRTVIYIGFIVVGVLGTFAHSTDLFHRVPEFGFHKNSAVWRVLAEAMGFTACVALFFAGLGPSMSLGGVAFVFALFLILCGMYDAIKRRAEEPPPSMNLK